MSLKSWINSRTRKSKKAAKRRQAARKPSRSRPLLEVLEDRTLLAVVFNPVFGVETTKQDNGAALSNPSVFLIFWGSY